MSRMFGKDGIRGMAITEFSCEFAMQTGRAAVSLMVGKNVKKPRIVVGRDTRNSGDALEAALCAGICSAGADCDVLGVVPAPAVAWYTKVSGACGGIMITASHLSAEFNGVKLYSPLGHRLSDNDENKIEHLVYQTPYELTPVERRMYGRIFRPENIKEQYIEHIKNAVPVSLEGMKVALDCSNGSAADTAIRLFRESGAEIVIMAGAPNGVNINRDCGSMHIDALTSFVKENGCICGLAFDGAGERCLAVDERGLLVDGDVILALCARDMKERNLLSHNKLVISPANNLGLLQFARNNDISVANSPSGEKRMVRKMIDGSFSIGGEPSGQMLFPDSAPSADGQLTGLKLLDIISRSGRPLSELSAIIEKCPQVMLNVPIKNCYREVWKNNKAITGLIDEFEEILGEEGRVIVREAGKEPVIRIMIEGKDFSAINSMALQIADVIKEELS